MKTNICLTQEHNIYISKSMQRNTRILIQELKDKHNLTYEDMSKLTGYSLSTVNSLRLNQSVTHTAVYMLNNLLKLLEYKAEGRLPSKDYSKLTTAQILKIVPLEDVCAGTYIQMLYIVNNANGNNNRETILRAVQIYAAIRDIEGQNA